MSRVRNGVVIIILCIIGAYSIFKRSGNELAMPTVADELKDTLAANPTNASRRGKNRASLKLPPVADEELKDSLAENPALPSGQDGNTEGQTPPPPRGSGYGGIGTLSSPNPGSELSPSSPQ